MGKKGKKERKLLNKINLNVDELKELKKIIVPTNVASKRKRRKRQGSNPGKQQVPGEIPPSRVDYFNNGQPQNLTNLLLLRQLEQQPRISDNTEYRKMLENFYPVVNNKLDDIYSKGNGLNERIFRLENRPMHQVDNFISLRDRDLSANQSTQDEDLTGIAPDFLTPEPPSMTRQRTASFQSYDGIFPKDAEQEQENPLAPEDDAESEDIGLTPGTRKPIKSISVRQKNKLREQEIERNKLISDLKRLGVPEDDPIFNKKKIHINTLRKRLIKEQDLLLSPLKTRGISNFFQKK
jgi:hypothetical protein